MSVKSINVDIFSSFAYKRHLIPVFPFKWRWSIIGVTVNKWTANGRRIMAVTWLMHLQSESMAYRSRISSCVHLGWWLAGQWGGTFCSQPATRCVHTQFTHCNHDGTALSNRHAESACHVQSNQLKMSGEHWTLTVFLCTHVLTSIHCSSVCHSLWRLMW